MGVTALRESRRVHVRIESIPANDKAALPAPLTVRNEDTSVNPDGTLVVALSSLALHAAYLMLVSPPTK